MRRPESEHRTREMFRRVDLAFDSQYFLSARQADVVHRLVAVVSEPGAILSP
jgi:hypothetical protein